MLNAADTSVLISTYNQPRELELGLASLCRQTTPPGEVLIGDDGSGDETGAVIDRWAARAPFPIHRVWQSDRGYRKARIMNEAARRARGSHFIFLDGDTFPHRAWVADHIAAADGNRVLCGRRVKLGPALSPEVTVAQIEAGDFDSAFSKRLLRSRISGDTKRWSLGVRLPAPIASTLHPRPRKLMGVNFSLPRKAFISVNGFNEEWTVYGHEDRDLELRLLRANYPRKALLNRAVVFHIHHEERERTDETRRLIAAAEESDAVRCEVGFHSDVPFDAAS